MYCQRCKKPLKRGYYFNGLAFGPECIKKVAGRKVRLSRLKQIKIERHIEESDLQMNLFAED